MSSADVDAVVSANEQSILAVLSAASTLNRDEVGQLAIAAGRSYDFAPRVAAISRDRKTARMLNKQSLEQWSRAFESPQGAAELVSPQAAALAADPFDVEVASNLAIVHFRAGNVHDAYRYAIYSMSLPRDADKEGRTADWNTLAAVFSARGQDDLAKSALLVTLTLTSNIAKRCEAAVHAVRHTYGSPLRIPTEHMFQIANERGLAAGIPECAFPVSW
jgi:thioredoxin-like negative regulator of GroEL